MVLYRGYPHRLIHPEAMKIGFNPYLRLVFLIAAINLGVLLLPVATVGVWLPDVFTSKRHSLALQTTTSGHTFQVVQYWNHSDSYTTELIHTKPDGRIETQLLDPDDFKCWRAKLTIDEPSRAVTIRLSRHRDLAVKC
jgi:hypothetical protein